MLQALLWVPVAVAVRDLVVDASFERASDGAVDEAGGGGGGMTPSVRPNELVVISKLDALRGALVTGDIVALKRNDLRTGGFKFRRLVALEGDWVRKKDNSFEQVPKGKCFVEADADENVSESLPIASLAGRAVGIIWPPSGVRSLDVPAQTRATYSDRVRKRDATTDYQYKGDQ